MSWITASREPPASVVTTGTPSVWASSNTLGRPSTSLASSMTSMAAIHGSTGLCRPASVTRSARPWAAIHCSSSARSTPSPTMVKRASGTCAATISATDSHRCGRLAGARRNVPPMSRLSGPSPRRSRTMARASGLPRFCTDAVSTPLRITAIDPGSSPSHFS